MAKMSLKILLAAFISSALFLFNSDNLKGCGPEYEFDNFYKIFEEKLFDNDSLKPFWLTEYLFNQVDEDGSVGPRLDNLKEWLAYFNNAPTIDDLENFIYKTSLEDFIIFYSSSENLKEEWKDNSVFAFTDREKLKEAVNYLIFAKTCEPHVSLTDPWEELKRDTGAMDSLITIALELSGKTENSFFKERYLYHAIRLAHYAGHFDKAISLFENLSENFNNKSLIYYWSLAHYAGAIRSSGNYAKANVLFARVFDNCPSRSRQSIISFRYRNDSLFTETLKSCEADHDKVLVYTLAAYKEDYLNLDAINAIYKYEPLSPYLSLILSRAISTLERSALPRRFPWYDYTYYLESKENAWYYDVDTTLYRSVFKIADENKTGADYLWDYAAGYIATLQNHPQDATKYFFEAKRTCPKNDLDIVKRIQIAEMICKVNSIKKIDGAIETNLYKDLKWLKETVSLKKLRSEDAFVYIINTLAKKYWQQGDTIKAHLCFGFSGKQKPWEKFFSTENTFNYDIARDYHKQPVHQIFAMINSYDYWEAPWKETHFSDWMRFLMDNYYYSKDDLEDIIIKESASTGTFEDVVSILERRHHYEFRRGIDKSFPLPANPFLIHIKDCHDCDYALKQDTVYTLYSFSRRMLDLKKLSEKEKNNNKVAEYYSLLANGYYNVTFYGNCWTASSFNTRGELPSYYMGAENFSFYDCSRAEEYYLKAASATDDKEFSAMCYFMAAKCEQNKFYNVERPEVYEWYSDKYDPKLKIKTEKYRNHFAKLVLNYSDTKFYKEALKECKYFNDFVTNYAR